MNTLSSGELDKDKLAVIRLQSGGQELEQFISEKAKENIGYSGETDIVFAQKGENPKGGRPAKDYALPFDTQDDASFQRVMKREVGASARKHDTLPTDTQGNILLQDFMKQTDTAREESGNINVSATGVNVDINSSGGLGRLPDSSLTKGNFSLSYGHLNFQETSACILLAFLGVQTGNTRKALQSTGNGDNLKALKSKRCQTAPKHGLFLCQKNNNLRQVLGSCEAPEAVLSFRITCRIFLFGGIQ